jgi:putative heme-binding domain-containing protein
LPGRFVACFFLCDFRGGPANSGALPLRLDRAGAGFEIVRTDRLIWRVLATDCDFAPDGSLYVLDWVDGWNKTGKGRIYRVRSPEMGNDMALRATAQLLGSDLAARGQIALQALLAHADRRVRQQAQFALVDLGAHDVLLATATAKDSRLARQHALWGLGILGRRDAKLLEPVVALLDDGDADVRATAARVLGDARYAAAIAPLEKRLADGSARVRREAAFALARCGSAAAKATKALLDVLRKNDDHDVVLRHAAAFALASVAPADELRAAAADPGTAVRRGVLLALARRQHAAVASFLTDADVTLRFDAARAIYEQPIPDAMQQLAQLCYDDAPDTDAIDWRAINANRLLGTVENGEALVHVASLATHPAATRREAIAVLGEWRAPHGQCRVTGNWRPCEHPRAATVADRFAGAAAQLLADPQVAAAAANAAARLGLTSVAGDLMKLVAAAAMPDDARVAALDALAALQAPQLIDALAGIGADAPVPLRRRAVALLSRTDPAKAVPVLATLLANGSTGEKQAAFEALGDLRHPDASALLRQWLERLAADDVDPALRVDLLDAAAKHRDDGAIAQALAARTAADEAGGPLGPWRVCVEGGDPQRGREVFFDHESTRCTRCHALGGNGGSAGPALDSIGRTLTKQQLLEALITPSSRIAEGFGTTTIDCNDGGVYVGVITKDQDGGITIVSATGEAADVSWTRISKRTPSSASSMPPMGGPLSRRQVRDLIAFLAKQKKS